MGKSPCSAQRPSRIPALSPDPVRAGKALTPRGSTPSVPAAAASPGSPGGRRGAAALGGTPPKRGWSRRAAGAQPGRSRGRAAPSQRAERRNLPSPGRPPAAPRKQAVLLPPALQAGSSSSVPAARRSGGVSQRVLAGAAAAAPLSAGRGAANGGRRRRAVARSRLFPGCAAEVAASSAAQLSSLPGLPAPRCPEVQPGRVRPCRSPSPAPLPGGEPRGAQAPPAARRTRGQRGIPAQPPALSPGPGAHSPRGEEALSRPGDQLREGHRHHGAEHGEAPSGTAAVAPIAAGPESATAGCRAPTGFAPCPCLETAPESECQAAPFPFLPSSPPAPSPLSAFPRRLPPAPGGRLPPTGVGAAAACPAGRGGAESGRRCRSAGAGSRTPAAALPRAGSAAAAAPVCLCHVCAWAGGGAGRGGASPLSRRPATGAERPTSGGRRRAAPAPAAGRPGPLHLAARRGPRRRDSEPARGARGQRRSRARRLAGGP
ncbi:translation initiation factor IF-2-like [Motacilla alba alba]|uniref:translation initiation factor IF-2-like n=1 Tax=Motacilla alba alba TaxID=1094192 RepID=UPI0018D541B8|nr:translation initiation factor IF-2-like [Motacilla alba alba]